MGEAELLQNPPQASLPTDRRRSAAASMLELNAVENIWQYLRQTYLANRVFADYAAVLDACRDA